MNIVWKIIMIVSFILVILPTLVIRMIVSPTGIKDYFYEMRRVFEIAWNKPEDIDEL